jgi:hypothetical protein
MPPKFGHIVFVDRSFGAHRLPNLLRKVGIEIEQHKDHFKDDEDDEVWIPEVTSRGWVIFTSDKRISKDPVNINAVLKSKAQVILTTDNNLLPEFWGASFVVGRRKLGELLERNPGPIYLQIGHSAGDHVRVVKRNITGRSRAETAVVSSDLAKGNNDDTREQSEEAAEVSQTKER